jgi:hypothetical protein
MTFTQPNARFLFAGSCFTVPKQPTVYEFVSFGNILMHNAPEYRSASKAIAPVFMFQIHFFE